MKNTFSLEQLFQTRNLDSNLILRQSKLDLVARLTEIKSLSPRLKRDQITKELGCSNGTLQRYRNNINLLSPYTIPSNSQKRRQKIANTNLDDKSNSEHDPKTTSNDPKITSKPITKKRSKLKGGSMQETDEINDENLHVFLHNNNL